MMMNNDVITYSLLCSAENWLNDAPEETTKMQYSEKLKALEKLGDPIVQVR